MKLYYYWLFKIYRQQQAVRILNSRSTLNITAAACMTVPFLGWLILVWISIALLETRLGLDIKSSIGFLVGWAVGLLAWSTFYWFNWHLLRSECYQHYENEFASYSASKQLLGSLFTLITMAANMLLPLWLLRFLS